MTIETSPWTFLTRTFAERNAKKIQNAERSRMSNRVFRGQRLGAGSRIAFPPQVPIHVVYRGSRLTRSQNLGARLLLSLEPSPQSNAG